MRSAPSVLAALAALLVAPCVTFAQPCCNATTGGEIGFVGPCKQAVIGFQTNWEHAIGTFDSGGQYHVLRGMRADDLVSTLSGGFRFLRRRLQLNGAIPFHVQRRDFEGTSPVTHAGIGDVSAAFDWSAIEGSMGGMQRGDPSSYLPFLDVFVASKAPTGRSPDESQHGSAVDVTSNGAWELSSGLKVTEFFTHQHALNLKFTWTHRFARMVDGHEFAPGERYTARLAWIHVPNLFWTWGLATVLTFTGPVREDGLEVPSSRTRRTQFGIYVTRVLVLPTWELTAALTIDALFDGGGRNIPFAGTNAMLAVQRNFM